MKELLNSRGEYNYRSFTMVQSKEQLKAKEPNKIFTIIGSEHRENSNRPLDMIDIFKSSDGILSTRRRSEILKAFKAGKIIPVLDSLITFRKFAKGEWEKIVGRSI